jgi:pilus assembly protein CpaB
MRPKSLILLALAGGCGIVASIGVSQVLESRSRVPAPMETEPIYVALHNINLGDPIDASMVSLQEWPKDKIPPGAISQLEDLEGRRPRTAIIQGEPLLEAKLLAPGQLADPIAQIPPEMRLVTVKVDAETSAAGLLSPGDRVDVQLFVHRDTRHGIDEPKTKIILQNIRVYAVDQAVQRSADGGESRTVAKTISLLLTPKQAGKVHLAEKVGEISLIPRNPDDESLADYDELTVEDLLSDSDKSSREKEQGRDEESDGAQNSGGGLLAAIQEAMPEKDPPFRMEIYLAGEFTEQFFDAETGKPIRIPAADPRQPLLSGDGGIGGPTQPLGPNRGAGPATPPSGGDAGGDFGGMDLSDFPIDLEGIE